MADIQMNDVSIDFMQRTVAAPSRRSARLQAKAARQQSLEIADQSMLRPGTQSRVHNPRGKRKTALSVKQPQADEGTQEHPGSSKLGKRTPDEAFNDESTHANKACRFADNDMDVDQPAYGLMHATAAEDVDMHQAAVPSFALSRQAQGPAERRKASKKKKAAKSGRKPNKPPKGGQRSAAAGNVTQNCSAMNMQPVDAIEQVTNNSRKRCQPQQPPPGASTELRQSKRLRAMQLATRLPYDIFEVIACHLEGRDLLSLMAVSKPMAKVVLSSRRTSGKPSVTVSIDRNTNWLPLHEIINLAPSIRLVITEHCHAAVQASCMRRRVVGETRLLGIREIVLQDAQTMLWLPQLAMACCSAHTYDLQFKLTDAVMEQLVRTPNITSLRVGSIEILDRDWSQWQRGWKSFQVHGEHVDYSSMAWLPLESIDQPVEWTSPTQMMCVVMPDSQDPDGFDTLMDAHANMHHAFFQLQPGAVLHYFLPQAVTYPLPYDELNVTLSDCSALAVAPHWPVSDIEVLISEVSTYVNVVVAQNCVPGREQPGQEKALECLNFCDPTYNYEWQCHTVPAVSIADLLGE